MRESWGDLGDGVDDGVDQLGRGYVVGINRDGTVRRL